MLSISQLILCAYPALSTIPLGSNGESPGAAADSPVIDSVRERGVAAPFSWGDFNGDGRFDLAAVNGAGALQLFTNSGDCRFEDVTDHSGLSNINNAALALWADYDGDGRLDLFIGAREGASRLFHNEAGVFIDMTAGSGFSIEGAVQSARWFDFDGDGRLDIFVITKGQSVLFRGLAGGYFKLVELPIADVGSVPVVSGFPIATDVVGADAFVEPSVPRPSDDDGDTSAYGARRVMGGRGSVSPSGMNLTSLPSISTPFPAPLFACATAIRDQANPNNCLNASTTPTLGMLYPISASLFVAVGGNVGMGTTTPAAKLDVAGTARMTDTLTLNPSGDQALDVSTGSIYKGGALFIHTKGAGNNTAIGQQALAGVTSGGANTAIGAGALFQNTTGSGNTAGGFGTLRSTTTGSFNTASGYTALYFNTSGFNNTASGARALFYNSTGSSNTAIGNWALYTNLTGAANTASGLSALFANTIGSNNTASGYRALGSNSTGSNNTACGHRALDFNSSGARNIALGRNAGRNLTTGNDNIAIGNDGVAGEGATTRLGTAGTQTRAFIAGIRGVTTGVADGIPVLVDSAGQLGTVSSSRRFKKDIADMGDATKRLLELRPVVFRYKQEQTMPDGSEVPLEYGLIAEEVAEIFPDLVVYDDEGKPFTVKYHVLSSMLLNEMKKLNATHQRELKRLHEALQAQGGAHSHELEEVCKRLVELEVRAALSTPPVASSAAGR